MAERSFGRTIRSLLVAMLNATLILVALCLWLAWGAFSTLERVTGTVQEVTSSLHPLRDELIVCSPIINGLLIQS